MNTRLILKRLIPAALCFFGGLGVANALTFNFSTIVNPNVDSPEGTHSQAQRTIVGTFTTNNAGLLTGFNGTLTGLVPPVTLTVAPGASPLNPTFGPNLGSYALVGGVYKMTGLNMTFTNPNPVGAGPASSGNEFNQFPWTLTFADYLGTNPGGLRIFTADNLSNFSGGVSDANFSAVPEINGAAIPKALLLLGSVLVLYRSSARGRGLA